MITCTFENGAKAKLRHVVTDAIVIKGKKLLLVKRAKTAFRGDKWGLPGGYVDRDETIDTAIVREVKEETNLKAKSIKLFKVIDNPNRRNEERQNICFVYVISAEGLPKPQISEVSEVRWFEFDKLPNKEEFAFDHVEVIQEYLKSKK